MKKIIASAAAAAFIALGLVAAAPASATTSGEVCVPAAAWTETVEVPAVGEPTLTVPNPDYVPAVPGIPAQGSETISVEVTNPNYVAPKDAVYDTVVTEREYKKFKGYWPIGWWDFQWFPATANPQGWEATGNVKTTQVETSPAQPAQGTPTIWVDQPNPAYVPAVPEVPAVGTETIEVANPDYVPASSYAVEHPAVTCPVPPAHNANGEATCGEWSITLYNQQGEGYENKTASFVVYIDGSFDNAYAVAGGEQKTISGTFAEDSGNHQVIVRTGPAQGDEFVFSLDVASDCEVTPPTEEPEEPVVPTTPTTPTTPVAPAAPAAAPAAPVKAAVTDETLAQTGGEPLWLGAVGAGLLIAVGATLYRRRRTI